MHRLVVRLGSLRRRDRAHRALEPLLEAELRQRDLARRLVELEVRERAVRDPVRLDADPGALEIGHLRPVDRAVENALGGEPFLVREWMSVVEVRDRREERGW